MIGRLGLGNIKILLAFGKTNDQRVLPAEPAWPMIASKFNFESIKL